MANIRMSKKDFQKLVDSGKAQMPITVINKKENLLFEDPDTKEDEYMFMRFELLYPASEKNPDANPIAKQSFRYMAQRDRNGDVITYTNDRTGKRDVIIKGYQDADIEKATDALCYQIQAAISKIKGFKPFDKDVHISKLECMFLAPKSMSKKEQEMIKTGEYIIFKDTKPDIDNIMKLIWDAFQKAGVTMNDSRVVSLNGVFKRYTLDTPGIIIELYGR